MNIHRALADVAAIRSQLDRAANYREFRSMATGISALVVLVGAMIEMRFDHRQAVELASNGRASLLLWLGVAVLSALIASGEMIIRGVRSRSRLVWRTHQKLIAHLMPAIIVGAVLTSVIVNQSANPDATARALAILPGVWALIFGLGLLNCRQELPQAALGVAGYYLTAGTISLLLDWLLPISTGGKMAVLFGVGQISLGIVLHWNAEHTSKPDQKDV